MIIKYLVVFLIFLTSFLNADSCYLIGGNNSSSSEVIKIKNSISWFYKDGRWIVSPPQESIDLSKLECNSRDYILLNDENISYATPNYDKKFYSLKKGWNYLFSHNDGIDVEKTFKKYKEVEFVYVYDKAINAWAGYSGDEKLKAHISTTRIINLEDIEANTGFYLYSNRSAKIKIESKKINNICKEYMNNSKNLVITDSGMDTAISYNEDKSMGVKSRYIPHYRRGIYSDSRVMLIYPKIEVISKVKLKYGPAKPKILLNFAKEYEGKEFYVYSYKDEKCFKGIFPSKMIPPFSSLKELK